MSEPKAQLTKNQMAAAVGRIVELSDLALVAIDSALTMPRREVIEFPSWLVKHGFTTEHRFDGENHRLECDIAFTLRAVKGQAPPGSPENAAVDADAAELFRLMCVFHLEYVLKNDPPTESREEFFGAFADVNAVFNAWPYFRELVQSTTMRMNLPPLVLKVFRIPVAPPAPKPAVAPKPAAAMLPQKP